MHPVILIIYYEGKKGWKIKVIKNFFDGFPQEVQSYIPSFESIFICLIDLSDDDLPSLRNGMLYSAFILQKHRFDHEILEMQIGHIFRSINPYLNRNFFQTILSYTLQVTELDKQKIVEIAQKVSPEIKSNIMSTYDQLVRKGEIKGKIEVILNAFENDLSISIISNITKISEDEVKAVLIKHGKII